MTKSNFEIKKIIEADEKLYQKFVDANVHIESFIAASDKDKKELCYDEDGKPFNFIKEVDDAVKKAETKEKKEEKKEEEEIAEEVVKQNV